MTATPIYIVTLSWVWFLEAMPLYTREMSRLECVPFNDSAVFLSLKNAVDYKNKLIRETPCPREKRILNVSIAQYYDGDKITENLPACMWIFDSHGDFIVKTEACKELKINVPVGSNRFSRGCIVEYLCSETTLLLGIIESVPMTEEECEKYCKEHCEHSTELKRNLRRYKIITGPEYDEFINCDPSDIIPYNGWRGGVTFMDEYLITHHLRHNT